MIVLPGQYAMERELGRGGMATVYLAQDLRHHRQVAVKVLRPELAAALGPERFAREIEIAARLQHPHILPLLDSGSAEGLLWYSMPFVEGESLRDLMARQGQLPLETAVRIARAVAQALHYAHQHGIVHRDVKPENILLSDGEALVADFGIARALGDAGQLTSTGLALGTPAYMSPEQATGERPVDGRADIYALGCVLYEMLAGEPPFTGPTAQAVIAKRFATAAPSVRVVRQGVPPSIEAAIHRALAREPADRFATAAELAEVLTAHPAEPTVATRRLLGTARSKLLVGSGVGVALAAVLWFGAAWGRRLATPSRLDSSALAVLPFRVVGPGLEVWREGMVDLFSLDLDGAAGLRTVHPRTVLSRWRREFGEAGAEADLDRALDVARGLSVRYAVTGSLVGGETGLRVTVELVDAATGTVESRAQVEGAVDSVPVLVDRLSLELLAAGLPDRSGGRVAMDLGGVSTRSLPALKSYLTGQQAFRHAQPQAAVTAFRRAAELDTGFALALFHLAVAEGWTGSPHYLGRELLPPLRQAARYPDRLPRREAELAQALILANDGETSSLQRLREVVKRYPDDAESWFLLGDALYHIGGAAFQPREAYRQALHRATVLDPAFAPPYLHLAEDAFDRLDSLEVGRIVTVLREIEPESPKTTGLGLMHALIWGDEAEKAAAEHALDTATAFAVLTAKHATNVTLDLAEYTTRVGNALGDQARHPNSERSQGRHGVAMLYEMRGQLKEGLRRWVESWKLGGRLTSEDIAFNVHYFQLLNGLVDIGDSLKAVESYRFFAGFPDSVLASAAAMAGLYAAHTGRWRDLDRWVKVASEGGVAAARTGDTVAGRRFREDARVLASLLAEHGGAAGAVTAELERAMGVYPGPTDTPGSTTGTLLRFELGRRYLASGDFRAARRQLESFYSWDFNPSGLFGILELQRGQVAEGLGELRDARMHYGNVVRWWKDCDPEARPVLEEARAGLVRLSGEAIAGDKPVSMGRQ